MENENLKIEQTNDTTNEEQINELNIKEENNQEEQPKEANTESTEPIQSEPTPENANVEENKLVEENTHVEQPTEPNNIQPPKKGAPVGLIIGIVVGVLVVVVILVLLLSRIFVTPKEVVNNGVSSVFKQARTLLKTSQSNILQYDLDKDSLGITGDLTIDSNYKDKDIDLSKLKNYKLNYTGVIDKKGNSASAGFALTKSNKDFLKANAYIDGNKAYFELGDLYNKTLNTKLEKEIKDLDLSTKTNIQDIDRLLQKTEVIVKNIIKNDNVTQTIVEKEFNDKKAKYTKVEYAYNPDDFETKLLEAYLQDDEAIKLIASISQKEEKDVREKFESNIKVNKDYRTATKETISIYLQGIMKNAVAYEIENNSESLLIFKDNKDYKLTFTKNNKEVLKGDYNTKTKTLNLKSNDGFSLVATFKNDTITADLNIEEDTTKLNVNAVINNKVKSSSQTNETTVKVDYSEGRNNISATITSRMKIEKNKKVSTIKTTPTVNVEDISDTELEDIYTKLLDKMTELEKDIMPNSTGDLTQFRKLI